jgi:hypothetical protein
MHMSLVTVTVMITAFYVGSRWGAVGIAAAWMVAHPVIIAPVFWRVLRKLDVSLACYLRVLRPGLDGSLLMAATVLGGQIFLWSSLPLSVRFPLEVTTGVVAFVCSTWLFHRERLRAAYGQLRLAWAPAT